jgi:class 3 adenylate cyclase
MPYQLQITPSVGKRWSYAVDKPLVKIGRSPHCDVVIDDPLVSREHCVVQVKPEGLFVEDLASANGTLVNDQRVTQVPLSAGDKIRLGLSEIVVVEVQHAAPEPQPPAQPEAPEPPLSPGPDVGAGEGPKHKRAKAPRTELPKKRAPAGAGGPGPSDMPASAAPGKLEPSDIPLFSKNQEPPTILVVHPEFSQIDDLLRPLAAAGAVILRAGDAGEVRSVFSQASPDCVLLSTSTEGTVGICQEVKSHPGAVPVVLLIHREKWGSVASLFQSGADEVIRQPDPIELQVRLRSMLELNRLRKEATLLTSQVEKRVSADVNEAERITRLKRYLSPQLVAAVLSTDETHVLKPTRQEVTIVFSDLRNFTHFSETSEPEEIIAMLSDFHALYGEIIFQYDGTLERFAGDGVMVFFGAPVPFKDHARRAVAMAVAARERLVGLRDKWKKLGYTLDVSFGISTGYVFVGNIGFEGRMDYAAIGKTTNLAARLCAAAKGGQILISRKTRFQVEDMVEVEEIGALEVKGFSEPVMAFNVLRLTAPFTPTPVA